MSTDVPTPAPVPAAYEPPTVTLLGSVSDLTQGGTDAALDSFGGSGDEGFTS